MTIRIETSRDGSLVSLTFKDADIRDFYILNVLLAMILGCIHHTIALIYWHRYSLFVVSTIKKLEASDTLRLKPTIGISWIGSNF